MVSCVYVKVIGDIQSIVVCLSVCLFQADERRQKGGVICLSGTSKGKGEGKGRRGCI